MRNVLFLFVLLSLSISANAAEYIIKQKDMSLKSSFQMQGVRIMQTHAKGNLTLIDINENNKAAILAEIMQDPNVEYVVDNFKIEKPKIPFNKAMLKNLKEQWANAKANLDKAWQIGGKGSKDVKIAVIDTGVDYNHESLNTNMVAGYDFRDNDADPMDETSARNPGHGTHCTGSIAGNGLIDGGIVGAIPNVSIIPIRFLGADGSGDLMGGIKSIDFAIEKGAHVISASWGATIDRGRAKALVEAVERADKAGVIFVAAAANDGKNNDKTEVYPANAGFPNTISVAASDVNDAKPSWSNFGQRTVHIASPGHNIMSTLPINKYGNLSGTSMATPLVAGIVGLLKSKDISLTGAQIRALLQSTGDKVSIETACNCRVDAGAAMQALVNKDMLLVPMAAAMSVNDIVQMSVMNAKGTISYASSDENIVSVDTNGLVTAKKEGTAKISAKTADQTLESLEFVVGNASSGGGDKPNPPGGGDGECPLGDPQLCEIMCGIQPDLPWCQ